MVAELDSLAADGAQPVPSYLTPAEDAAPVDVDLTGDDGAQPGADQPEGDEAPVLPELPEGWEQHPAIVAVFEDQRRQARTEAEQHLTEDAIRLLDGEVEAKNVSARVRRLAARLQEKIEAFQQPGISAELARIHADHDRLLELEEADPYAWRDEMRNPRKRALYNQMLAAKEELGLPATASAAQLHAAYEKREAERMRRQARETGGIDLDDEYEELRDDPKNRDLTAEDWQAIAPANFRGTTKQVLRQMAEAVAERRQQAALRKRAEAAAREGARLNQDARNARAAGQNGPPNVGGRAGRAQSFEQIADQWWTAKQNGTLTPEMDASFWEAKRIHDGRGGSWVP